MAWTFFHSFKKLQLDAVAAAAVNFATGGDDIRLALITATTAPLVATHDFWDDLVANEVSGTNYTAGGTALASKTLTLTAGVVTFDSADVTFLQSDPGGFANARYAVLRRHNATASLSVLIAFEDLGGDKGNVSGDLTLQMHANGIFTLT